MSDPVAEVMAATSRADFLPAAQRGLAGVDGPVPIGHGQTNSQPRTVEAMLRLLDVGRGMRVLDVGSGSGWTTALLARLVGRDGEVVGVEIVADLVERGSSALRAVLPETAREPGVAARVDVGRARIVSAADGVLGRPEQAPYDRVLVSAQAGTLPDALVEQVAAPGVLVLPVRGQMLRVVRDPDGDVTVTRHGAYRFVPLLGA